MPSDPARPDPWTRLDGRVRFIVHWGVLFALAVLATRCALAGPVDYATQVLIFGGFAAWLRRP